MPPKKSKPASTAASTKAKPGSAPKGHQATSSAPTAKSTAKKPDNKGESMDFAAFSKIAKPLVVPVADEGGDKKHTSLVAQVKKFSTGGYGWSASEDAQIPVGKDGQMMNVLITLNITVKNPKKPLASKKPKANAPSSNAATAETSTAGRKRKVVEVEMGNEDDVDGDEQEGNEGSEESGAVSDDEEY